MGMHDGGLLQVAHQLNQSGHGEPVNSKKRHSQQMVVSILKAVTRVSSGIRSNILIALHQQLHTSLVKAEIQLTGLLPHGPDR